MHYTYDEYEHKDLQKTSMQRDEEDVCKLVVQFEKSNVFNNSENLISLVSNDISYQNISFIC